METQICRTCFETYPLTEKFWNHSKQYKSGFIRHCKTCSRASQREADARFREKRKMKLEVAGPIISYNTEPFGEFEAACLREKAERMFNLKPVISIYREI